MTEKATNGSAVGLGVLTGYGAMAREWGPDTKPRQIAYMAERGKVRVSRDGRTVRTTIERLREDRDRLLGSAE